MLAKKIITKILKKNQLKPLNYYGFCRITKWFLNWIKSFFFRSVFWSEYPRTMILTMYQFFPNEHCGLFYCKWFCFKIYKNQTTWYLAEISPDEKLHKKIKLKSKSGEDQKIQEVSFHYLCVVYLACPSPNHLRLLGLLQSAAECWLWVNALPTVCLLYTSPSPRD